MSPYMSLVYLQLRGLAITNLRLDLGHQGGAEASKQEFSVRLVRADSNKSMPSGGWRWVTALYFVMSINKMNYFKYTSRFIYWKFVC